MSTRDAVLLDVDGTLVDTSYLHVVAWLQAFRATGHEGVPGSVVHRCIGASGDVLVRTCLGEVDEAAKEAHTERYATMYDSVAPLDGAVDLVHELSRRGLAVALASSASGEEEEMLRDVLADASDAWEVFTSSADAESGKPDPSVLEVALDRLGVPASRAVLVGDSTWDVAAAGRIGVPTVGVATGGVSVAELREVGAVAVFDGPRHLLECLDSPAVARYFS